MVFHIACGVLSRERGVWIGSAYKKQSILRYKISIDVFKFFMSLKIYQIFLAFSSTTIRNDVNYKKAMK